MTKSVALGSIEYGLREAFRMIGVDGVNDAITAATGQGKSSSLLRKYADPDDARHHLPLRDALIIDRACVKSGHAPPLLQAYQLGLEASDHEAESFLSRGDLCLLALGLEAASGAVAETALHALECNGGRCELNSHADEIYRKLQELDEATMVLRKEIALMGLERLC
jgi:hypothetical protein